MGLKREQIIKALECCTSGNSVSACMSGCPLYEKEDCECINDDTALLKYALSLIEELTSENKLLNVELGNANSEILRLIEEKKELTAKTEAQDIVITELRKLLEKANHDADRYARKIKELTEENEWLRELGTIKEVEKEIVRRETRADTVRKMQEQIKAEIDYFDKRGGSAFINKAIVFFFIDQIAKDMLEEEK